MRRLSTRGSQDRAWNGVCWWWISWQWGWYQHAARCMKFQQRASPVSSLVLLCFSELHAAEYLKRRLSFVEPGGSLPCSEELCAGSCLQPDEASTQIRTLLRICFNSNLGSGIWYGLSCGFPLGFLIKILCAFLITPVRYSLPPTRLLIPLACKTFYTIPVYTTVFLKMNPHVQNL